MCAAHRDYGGSWELHSRWGVWFAIGTARESWFVGGRRRGKGGAERRGAGDDLRCGVGAAQAGMRWCDVCVCKCECVVANPETTAPPSRNHCETITPSENKNSPPVPHGYYTPG